MKTLKESLFDSNLVSRDLTIGDMFKLYYERSSVSAKYYTYNLDIPITDCIDVDKLKRDTKVSGSDDKVILNGFAKLFLDIPLKLNYYDSWTIRDEYIRAIENYLHFDEHKGKKYVIVQFYKSVYKYSKDMAKINDPKNVNEIVVNISGSIILRFKRA